MGTPIKLAVCVGKMATVKTYLTGRDGADYPLVRGFDLSLSRTGTGKWDCNFNKFNNRLQYNCKLYLSFLQKFLFSPNWGPIGYEGKYNLDLI